MAGYIEAIFKGEVSKPEWFSFFYGTKDVIFWYF